MDKTKGTRFKVREFRNPSGAIVWRVDGTRRNGERVRENFGDVASARSRSTELEIEFLGGDTPAVPKVTRLDHRRLAAAEKAFDRLGDDAQPDEILTAVELYLAHGRPRSSDDVPRLDGAKDLFDAWLDATPTLRPRSKDALRMAVRVLSRSLGNPRLSSITTDALEDAIGKLGVGAVSKDVYRRGWSRFFAWCIERPRRWLAVNPVREVRLERAETPVPAILTVDQCRRVMRASEAVADGALAPWFALALFGGLRPTEAARLGWPQVNLGDGEIRLEGGQTKDGRPRVVTICATLRDWLQFYRDKPLRYSRRLFRQVIESAGLGEWKQDALRHTGASHRIRQLGSFARVAEEFGNSEAMLKKHYQGRVTSAETAEFYAIKPNGGQS